MAIRGKNSWKQKRARLEAQAKATASSAKVLEAASAELNESAATLRKQIKRMRRDLES